MMTEQRLQEIEAQHQRGLLHRADIDDLIVEARRLKQEMVKCQDIWSTTIAEGMESITELQQQRDATLGTYAEAEKRWKTIIAARDREQALYVQANHDFRDALTEAHRVLREVEWSNGDFCPICTGLHPKGHRSGCALAAVLAQDTHA